MLLLLDNLHLIAWSYMDQPSSSILYHHLDRKSNTCVVFLSWLKLRRIHLYHLIVHSISLLMASTYTLAMSSSLLLSSPLPHQLPPIFLHIGPRFVLVCLKRWFSLVLPLKSLCLHASRRCTLLFLWCFESTKWSVFCYPVLNPFVWQPYEPIPAITA